MGVALEELGEAVKLDPANARAYNIYGLVYSTLGQNEKAEQSFQRALALAPSDSEIRHNWGWYLCTHDRARESIPVPSILFLIWTRPVFCVVSHLRFGQVA